MNISAQELKIIWLLESKDATKSFEKLLKSSGFEKLECEYYTSIYNKIKTWNNTPLSQEEFHSFEILLKHENIQKNISQLLNNFSSLQWISPLFILHMMLIKKYSSSLLGEIPFEDVKRVEYELWINRKKSEIMFVCESFKWYFVWICLTTKMYVLVDIDSNKSLFESKDEIHLSTQLWDPFTFTSAWKKYLYAHSNFHEFSKNVEICSESEHQVILIDQYKWNLKIAYFNKASEQIYYVTFTNNHKIIEKKYDFWMMILGTEDGYELFDIIKKTRVVENLEMTQSWFNDEFFYWATFERKYALKYHPSIRELEIKATWL